MKFSPNEVAKIRHALEVAEEELDLVSFETWPGSEEYEKSTSAQEQKSVSKT